MGVFAAGAVLFGGLVLGLVALALIARASNG